MTLTGNHAADQFFGLAIATAAIKLPRLIHKHKMNITRSLHWTNLSKKRLKCVDSELSARTLLL